MKMPLKQTQKIAVLFLIFLLKSIGAVDCDVLNHSMAIHSGCGRCTLEHKE